MGKKGIGKVLTGAAIGVGIGMLVAPKSGKETREDLKKGAQKTLDKIKDIDLDEVKDNLAKEYEKLKKELSTMDKEKAKKIATKKVKELSAKTSELVEMAKEKSAPVVEKSAKELKKKLSDLLEDVQNKLAE